MEFDDSVPSQVSQHPVDMNGGQTRQRVRALDLLKSRGMLRQRDFMAEGIGPETLARLVRGAAVVRPARGLYQLPDTQIEAAHMLAEAAVLVPKGVVCLTSRFNIMN